ncbi:MAG: hypothetical protein RMY36_020895 [Nostoc sp. SerVER01]|nr:hypothetical protein [Nostoc sp. SerVER01]
MTTAEFAGLLAECAKPQPFVLDARSQPEYAVSHIRTAVLIISSASILLTGVLYELLIKRINISRFLFGLKPIDIRKNYKIKILEVYV